MRKIKTINCVHLDCFSKAIAMMSVVLICLSGGSCKLEVSAAIILIASVLILQPEFLIGPIIFLSVFDTYLMAFPNNSFCRVFVIVFLIGLVTKFLVKEKKIKNITFLFDVFLILIMIIVLSFYTIDSFKTFPYTMVLNLGLVGCMMNSYLEKKENLYNQLLFFCMFAIVYGMVLLYGNIHLIKAGQRIVSIGNMNINQFALGITQIFSCFLGLYVVHPSKKVICAIGCMMSFFVLLICGSRTCVIAAGVTVLIVILINARKKRRSELIKLISCVLGLFFLICIGVRSVFPAIIARFSIVDVIKSKGTTRVDIWMTYFKYIFPQYWLFGIGFDPLNMYYLIGKYTGRPNGAHNVIIEILSSCGCLGMILFGRLFCKCYKKFKNYVEKNSCLWIPILMLSTILLCGIGEDIIRERFLWFDIGLGFMLINSSDQKENVMVQ